MAQTTDPTSPRLRPDTRPARTFELRPSWVSATLAGYHRPLHSRLARWRRPLCAVLAGLLTTAILLQVQPAAPGRDVIVTTRELSRGQDLADAVRVVQAPADLVPTDAVPVASPMAGRAARGLASGVILTQLDVDERAPPDERVTMPVPVPAAYRAWLRADDELLLYPRRSSGDPYSPPGETFDTPIPIGPVRVLRTTPDAPGVSRNDGSDAASVLVLVDADQAPRLADAATTGWLLPALMP